MEKLKRDLEHIKKYGIDSGALFRRVRKYLKELAEYKETGLTQAELLLFKTVKDIDLDTPAIRLVDILFAEQAGRLVVLPEGVTRAALEDDLRTMEQQVYGDAAETYTTGYRNGHKNGMMEVLHRVLGVPDDTRSEAEAAAEYAKTAKEEI